MPSLLIFASLYKINIILHTPTLINSTILGKEINSELQSLIQHCEESLPGSKGVKRESSEWSKNTK